MEKKIVEIAKKIALSENYKDTKSNGMLMYWYCFLEKEIATNLIQREIDNINILFNLLKNKHHTSKNKYGNISSGDSYFWVRNNKIFYKDQNHDFTLLINFSDLLTEYKFSDGYNRIDFKNLCGVISINLIHPYILQDLDYFFSAISSAINYKWHEY